MPLDGITTQYLSNELDMALRGARIDKIYQPEKYDLVLHLRSDNENMRLLLSSNPVFPRIHLTDSSRDNPAYPPSFCMLLRKHLSGARIINISSPPYERIIEIHCTVLNELNDVCNLRLIIEMMGRYSNIILVNNQSKIIDSILHVDARMSRIREVMPARPYDYPPAQGKLLPTEALDLLHVNKLPILESALGRPLEKAFLESLLGFSPLLAREICHLASIDPRKGCRQLSDEEKVNLIHSASTILKMVLSNQPSPCTYSSTKDAIPSDFHAFILRDAGFARPSADISSAIDTVFKQSTIHNDFIQSKRVLSSFANAALSHAVKKRSVHEADIFSSKDYLIWRKSGELILTHQNQISSDDFLLIADDYEHPDVKLKISLDPNKSSSANAQAYFKRYRKAKNRIEAAEKFIAEDNGAIQYLRVLCQALEVASEKEDLIAIKEEMSLEGLLAEGGQYTNFGNSKSVHSAIFPGKSKSGKSHSRAIRSAGKAASQKSRLQKKKASDSNNKSSESFRKFSTDDGLTVLCGRNNIQNDLLTFRVASPDDFWFHAKNMPGTHVVLRCNSSNVPDSSIVYAASVAAYYSKGATSSSQEPKNERATRSDTQSSNEIKIDVDYCLVKHVKKIPKSKPGMVTYSHQKTLLVPSSHPGKL